MALLDRERSVLVKEPVIPGLALEDHLAGEENDRREFATGSSEVWELTHRKFHYAEGLLLQSPLQPKQRKRGRDQAQIAQARQKKR